MVPRMRPKKKRPRAKYVCHMTVLSLLKSVGPSLAMVTSPHERTILEQDVRQQLSVQTRSDELLYISY